MHKILTENVDEENKEINAELRNDDIPMEQNRRLMKSELAARRDA